MPPISSSSQCPSATHQVLAITELREQILHALPTLDLLRAQRISHIFRATITTSPRLQRALYLAPAPAEQIWLVEKGTLGSKLAPQAVAVPSPEIQNPASSSYSAVPCSMNPLLLRRSPVHSLSLSDSRAHPLMALNSRIADGEIATLTGRGRLAEICFDADGRADGSWKRMLLTQPPCKLARGVVFDAMPSDGQGVGPSLTFGVSNGKGVRCGDLVVKINEEVAMLPFGVPWRKPWTVFLRLPGVVYPFPDEDEAFEANCKAGTRGSTKNGEY